MDLLTAVSVLDGRYASYTTELTDIVSEYGLFARRVFVETQWLLFLSEMLPEHISLSATDRKNIESISAGFNTESARLIKQIEQTTNHDVKAVEYFIKRKLDDLNASHLKEWVHFACTSEDINNTAYALMLADSRTALLRRADEVIETIEQYALQWKAVPMMSRTHGQPASPTTVGKELVVFAARLRREREAIASTEIAAKMNGATGTFGAHTAAFPTVDWIEASRRFISDYLHLSPLLLTTQINPYNTVAELLHAIIRFSATLIDVNRDMWGYISFGYFSQKLKKGEIGSSTMPHKVNPINFENSEGNAGIAVSLAEHMATKLLISRFQRDLTDSTVLRNLGSIFGYLFIALGNTLKGLNKIELNRQVMLNDLTANIELLAEPVQTVMRVWSEQNPYERLKTMTRGKRISAEEMQSFILSLSKVPEEERSRLAKLTPDKYIGKAEQLVDYYFANGKKLIYK